MRLTQGSRHSTYCTVLSSILPPVLVEGYVRLSRRQDTIARAPNTPSAFGGPCPVVPRAHEQPADSQRG